MYGLLVIPVFLVLPISGHENLFEATPSCETLTPFAKGFSPETVVLQRRFINTFLDLTLESRGGDHPAYDFFNHLRTDLDVKYLNYRSTRLVHRGDLGLHSGTISGRPIKLHSGTIAASCEPIFDRLCNFDSQDIVTNNVWINWRNPEISPFWHGQVTDSWLVHFTCKESLDAAGKAQLFKKLVESSISQDGLEDVTAKVPGGDGDDDFNICVLARVRGRENAVSLINEMEGHESLKEGASDVPLTRPASQKSAIGISAEISLFRMKAGTALGVFRKYWFSPRGILTQVLSKATDDAAAAEMLKTVGLDPCNLEIMQTTGKTSSFFLMGKYNQEAYFRDLFHSPFLYKHFSRDTLSIEMETLDESSPSFKLRATGMSPFTSFSLADNDEAVTSDGIPITVGTKFKMRFGVSSGQIDDYATMEFRKRDENSPCDAEYELQVVKEAKSEPEKPICVRWMTSEEDWFGNHVTPSGTPSVPKAGETVSTVEPNDGVAKVWKVFLIATGCSFVLVCAFLCVCFGCRRENRGIVEVVSLDDSDQFDPDATNMTEVGDEVVLVEPFEMKSIQFHSSP